MSTVAQTRTVAPRWVPTAAKPVPLGERLIRSNLISADELQSALQLQVEKGQRIGETLIELGVISEEQLLPFIEEQLGMPAVRLRDGMLDPAVVRTIPQPVATRIEALAMFRVRDTLTVALSDPQNLSWIDELERITRLRVRPVFAFAASIRRILERCYKEDFQVDSVTADLDEAAVELQADLTDVDLSAIEQMVDGSPVINLVNYLILQAIRKGASDIHVEPARSYSVVRYRIDGQLVEVLRPRREIHPAVISRVKVMGKMDIAEQRVPQDGRCQVLVDGKQVDLRISTLPTVLGEKIVMRVLDKQRLTFDLEKLGMAADTLQDIKQMLARPYGLMLVTGPTGSGKTTTLYSALELVKSVHRNVVTVEDPVEYQIELVNQVQVDSARTLTFANSLRSILRQDPDVIMIGEIRDSETAQVAVQAALTGHLVLSTLHTNDSVSAVTRLVDMGVEPFKLAAAVVGVIAQRLVRTICQSCETSYYPKREFLEAIHYQGDMRRSFRRGEGCRDCFDTGCKGRVGIYEVLTANNEIRRFIADGAPVDMLRQWMREQGARTLLEAGLQLAEQEITSLEEVARVALFE